MLPPPTPTPTPLPLHICDTYSHCHLLYRFSSGPCGQGLPPTNLTYNIDVHTVLFRKLTISRFAPCLATSYFPPWVACSSVCYWHTIFASALRWVCEPRKVSLHPRAVFWEDEGQGYFWL